MFDAAGPEAIRAAQLISGAAMAALILFQFQNETLIIGKLRPDRNPTRGQKGANLWELG